MGPEPSTQASEPSSWQRLDRAFRTVLKVSKEELLKEEATKKLRAKTDEKVKQQ